MVRASRLVSLLMLLQTRERMTARELAAELEVSVRTVYRDVESLGAAGVPVYGEPGHEGGYRLVEGYRTRLTGLTAPEAESLFLASLPAAADQLGMGSTAAAAQLKLLAALPEQTRVRADSSAKRFHLDAPSWYHEADRVPHLAAVASAVWQQRTVAVRYLRWAQPQEIARTVEPHGIVLKGGRWYVVARATQGEMRTYRVSRLSTVDVLASGFEREPGFDLAAYWADQVERFDHDRFQGTATLRLSPRGVERLPHVFEHALADTAHRTAGPPDEAGWVEVTIPVEPAARAVPELLRLGADAEILDPPELREHMTSVVEAFGAKVRKLGPEGTPALLADLLDPCISPARWPPIGGAVIRTVAHPSTSQPVRASSGAPSAAGTAGATEVSQLLRRGSADDCSTVVHRRAAIGY